MDNFELLRFDRPLAVGQAAAEALVTLIQSVPSKGHPHTVALSGGRIAQLFFSAIVENAKKRALSFTGVNFFWADERCVPPSHPESNFAMADKWLFQPLGFSATSQIHRIRGELRPDEAAQQASRELRQSVPANAAGQPVLDTIFLGM